MARFKILSADGSKVRFEGCPKYVGAYLKPSHLEFSQVCSPTPIDWQVGDYVDYYRTGLRYRLFSIPQATKNARKMSYGSAFVYENVQLFSATKELEIALFRDLVPNDNGIHFSTAPDVSTFENVAGVARRIQACMDDAFPNRWIIAVADVLDEGTRSLMAETKEFSISNGSCLSALEQIYNTWKNIGWSHTYDAYSGKDIITIGATSVRTAGNTTEVFAYGKRQGLSSIKKADANKDGFATRLYVYGSERNIQTRYYNRLPIHNADSVDIRHLMIPPKYWGTTDGLPDARKAYLQASDAIVSKYGLIPRTIYFDGGENEEIYPSIKGMKAIELYNLMIESGEGDSQYLPDPTEERIDKAVSASGWGDGSKEDTEEFPDFTMTIQQVGFNIAEQGKLTAEGHATISMVSGACAGREFKVKLSTYDRNDRPVLHLEKFWDDSVGMAYPNNLYPINAGDEFVILDIPMPDFYITYAQEKLYKKGQQMLADYTKVSAFYEPSIDPIMVEEKGARLREGMFMQIKDEDIVDGSNNVDYVLIDTISIDESGILPTYNVTLREQKRSATTFSSLKEMIDDAKYESKAEFKKERRYVERRFRTAQETMEMLQGAIEGFTPGINPLTLQTMSVLVGSQSLQFAFIKSLDSTEKDTPAFAFDPATKIFSVPESVLMHYTIGQNEILVSQDKRTSFAKWEVNAFEGSPMLDAEKAYYLYVFAPFEGKADFYITDTARVFKDEDGYNLLVGIINSETEGTRDFAPLYGFTEILPGQITTDVIRSADGGTYFDLANNEIGGVIKFKAGSEGLENILQDGIIGGQNMLRNSGFTGDYISEPLADESVMDAAKELFSDPLDHWEAGQGNKVVALEGIATSGYGVEFTDYGDSLRQELHTPMIAGESYVFSFKGRSTAVDSEVTIVLGGQQVTIEIGEEWKTRIVRVTMENAGYGFGISGGHFQICDLQLERGTIATAYSPSYLDNISDRAYYQSLKYVEHALNEGSTTIGGGLVLTNHIKVGNYANKEMIEETGGMQGTYNVPNDPFLWGGGSLDKAIETIKKYKDNPSYQPTEEELKQMANFVVTHGGKAILNDIILRGYVYALGGKIGDLVIKDNGISVDTESDATVAFSHSGLMVRQKGEGNTAFTQLGACGSEAITINGKDSSVGLCYFDKDLYKIAAQINAADGYHAIHSLSGVYAGLRPNIRKVEENSTLTALDHTIVVSNRADIILTLPKDSSNPSARKGQTYKLIHTTDNAVSLSADSDHKIQDVLTGSSVTSLSGKGTFVLTYLEGVWYLENNN